jgi:hypothetical protein
MKGVFDLITGIMNAEEAVSGALLPLMHITLTYNGITGASLEIIMPFIETKIPIIETKIPIIETKMAIMNAMIAIMISLFQIMVS